jgi:ribosomal protein L40E
VGSGWYDEGSKALITAPENPPANIFVKRRLTGFTGDCDDCTYNNGRMVLTMDRPRTITAAYTSEPDIVNLSILAGVVAAGGMVYAAGKRGPKVEKDNENKKLKLTTCDVCGSKIPADATFCPYCGVGLVEVEPQAVDTSE